jgi:hypothetical protein
MVGLQCAGHRRDRRAPLELLTLTEPMKRFLPLLTILVVLAVVVNGQQSVEPAPGGIDVETIGETAVATGAGASNGGTQRVILSNDSALAANQSVNLTQFNGVTPLMNNGVSGTGSQRMNVASDNTAVGPWGQGATGSAVPSGAQYIAGNGSGNLTGYINCDKTVVYDTNTNGTTQLVALSSGQIVYVCGYSFSQSTTTSVNVSLVYGTGSACATGQTAITPAYPIQAPASAGPIGIVVQMPFGSSGLKTTASQELCIKTNAAVSVQAIVSYTQF